VDRLGHLASSLLSFAKPSPPRIQAVRVDEAVEQTVEGLSAHPERHEVTVDCALEAPLVAEADPYFLVTALDNLVRNAIEAGIAAKDLGKIAQPAVRVRARRQEGEVVVEVEDNAGGLPAELEATLFTPFVSGKPRGIGLGLAMARRAMEQQGGSLAFSRTADGSRFTLRIREHGRRRASPADGRSPEDGAWDR
jgi:C4-dicarboxylate-specific signal transduction histidine kinase